jgi:hypothetical protein
MLGVLALGAVQGTEVTLSAGDDAAGRAAVDRLAAVLATDLDTVGDDEVVGDDGAVGAIEADA